MYLIKTPKFIKSLFPNFIWNLPRNNNQIYLTFDDGPIPEVTPWVLDLLKQYNAQATFFCVGENVIRYPDIYKRIVDEGHSVGNHTLNHLNGWVSDNIPYFHNVRHCASQVDSDLFRPPYGKLKPKQVQFLQRHYKIIMWDVLSGDFDPGISKEQCLNNVMDNAESGSIIVFHDSLKAEDKLRFVLPRVLEHFTRSEFIFKKISRNSNSAPKSKKQIA